jgi:hypothetical protein
MMSRGENGLLALVRYLRPRCASWAFGLPCVREARLFDSRCAFRAAVGCDVGAGCPGGMVEVRNFTLEAPSGAEWGEGCGQLSGVWSVTFASEPRP